MIINPTQKSQVIFNKLPKVKDKNDSILFSQSNPFFSWHANYFNYNRKKIVLLVNDLTYMTIVLADVNADVKKNLNQIILDAIGTMFTKIGISEFEIKKYLKLSGEIEINAGYDRKVTGVVTNFITILNYTGLDIDNTSTLQVEMSMRLSQYPIKIGNYYYATERVVDEFKNNLQINEVVPKQPITFDKKWQDLHHWDQYKSIPENTDGKQLDKIMEDIQANNQWILREFKLYLEKVENLGKKTVNRHVNNVAGYMNTFLLYYDLHTIITDFLDPYSYLTSWYPTKIMGSSSDLKQEAGSLRKLYKFLNVVGEITDVELKDVKANIKIGTDEGLEMLDDFYY